MEHAGSSEGYIIQQGRGCHRISSMERMDNQEGGCMTFEGLLAMPYEEGYAQGVGAQGRRGISQAVPADGNDWSHVRRDKC